MQKDKGKQTRKRKSIDGKRISPKVSFTSLDIVNKTGMSNGEFYERSTRAVVFKDTHLIAREEIIKFKLDDLEQDIKEIKERAAADIERKQKSINQYKAELAAINDKLNNYIPSESENAQKALGEAMELIKKAREESEGKLWGLKRVPLNEFAIIAKNNFIPLETLLAAINDDVKRKWID